MPSSPLPSARGPISEHLLEALRRSPDPASGGVRPSAADDLPDDPAADDDVQLALYLCYELHYRGLAGVADEWEWDPSLLALRGRLEQAFERAVRQMVTVPANVDPAGMDLALAALIRDDDAPALSSFVERKADEFTKVDVVKPGETRLGSTGGQRYDLWRIAWHGFEARPVTGGGEGSYTARYYRERATDRNLSDPHSLPLRLLSELGLVGCGCREIRGGPQAGHQQRLAGGGDTVGGGRQLGITGKRRISAHGQQGAINR